MLIIDKTFCNACGVHLEGQKKRQKYCSKDCYHLATRKAITLRCLHCHALFQTAPSAILKGGGKYCTHTCYDLDRPIFDPKVNFWPNVEKSDGCHLWVGAKNPRGYGHLGISGKTVSAHRVAYELQHGKIPSGFQINHTCDVRACVNHEHLYAGSAQQNTADMIKRQRSVLFQPGVEHHAARLTPAQIKTIRVSRVPAADLAREMGVSKDHISRIRRGERWASL